MAAELTAIHEDSNNMTDEQRFNVFKEKIQKMKKNKNKGELNDNSSFLFVHDFVKCYDLNSEFDFQHLPQVLSLVNELPGNRSQNCFQLLLGYLFGLGLTEDICDNRFKTIEDAQKYFELLEAGRKRLFLFLDSCDKKLLQEWSHSLIYVATYYALPEIFKYVPNLREILQKDLLYARHEADTEGEGVIHFYTNPMSLSGKDVEETYNILLKNGYNVFLCQENGLLTIASRNGGRVGIRSIKSCLMSDVSFSEAAKIVEYFSSDKKDAVEDWHSLNFTLLPLLEAGAGFLNAKARFCPLAFWSRIELGNDIEFFNRRLKGLLQQVTYNLVDQRKLEGIDSEKFPGNLMNAEIVFKISNENRIIFSMAEFIQYLDNYDRLPDAQKEVIKTMRDSVNRLSEKQREHLVPGFREILNAVILRQEFIEATTPFLNSQNLLGNKVENVTGVICSYVATQDFINNQSRAQLMLAAAKPDIQGVREQWKAREQASLGKKPEERQKVTT